MIFGSVKRNAFFSLFAEKKLVKNQYYEVKMYFCHLGGLALVWRHLVWHSTKSDSTIRDYQKQNPVFDI